MGRHVCMFVVDDVQRKLKGCRKKEVVVPIESSLHFHGESDL